MPYYKEVETALGTFGIIEENGAITFVLFHPEKERPKECTEQSTPLLERAAVQLSEYALGKRRDFDLPLSPKGTEFQKKVWEELQKIPYGDTISYQELARRIGNPKACRAVGAANGKNPIPIIIPCHRVIGENGTLTGFGGGLALKETMINLEAGQSMLL